MRKYTDYEILKLCEEAHNFNGFPTAYWMIGVQSLADKYNEFDDKLFIYFKTDFIMMLTGTTNAGASALMNYKKYNPLGTAILKTNEWYYDCWKPGLHKGRMKCLKQVKPMLFYRDNNKNKKVEEIGKLHSKLIGCEFHTSTYTQNMNFIRKLIGGWSAVCQVANDTGEYYKALKLFWSQKSTSYCLLKEEKY